MTKIEYKFNEDQLIQEFKDYIDKTYSEHYACDGQIQSLEVIFDRGHGLGFVHGNIDKYNGRYGKKEGFNRKDLQKILHYSLLALYLHDKRQPELGSNEEPIEDEWFDNPFRCENIPNMIMPDNLITGDKVDLIFEDKYIELNVSAMHYNWGGCGGGTIMKYRLVK